MATMIRYTPGQQRTQARIIRDLFGVDPADVRENFEMESVNPDRVLLTIHAVKFIDRETANALLAPVETPEEADA